MTPFQKLIEERILEAMDNGEFDKLPGKGRPLELEDDSHVPPELRVKELESNLRFERFKKMYFGL